jgi:hypothetical protein
MAFRTWLEQNPAICLAALIAFTALAAIIQTASRHRLVKSLRELAGQWRMTYSAHDRFGVATRIAHRLPLPGAADVFVTDVIYGSREGKYRYIFTAEYTVGVIWGKQRHVRVAAFTEPRDRHPSDTPGTLVLAADGLPLVEQYRSLAPDANPGT